MKLSIHNVLLLLLGSAIVALSFDILGYISFIFTILLFPNSNAANTILTFTPFQQSSTAFIIGTLITIILISLISIFAFLKVRQSIKNEV
jgi:uncharacterized membrane protein